MALTGERLKHTRLIQTARYFEYAVRSPGLVFIVLVLSPPWRAVLVLVIDSPWKRALGNPAAGLPPNPSARKSLEFRGPIVDCLQMQSTGFLAYLFSPLAYFVVRKQGNCNVDNRHD